MLPCENCGHVPVMPPPSYSMHETGADVVVPLAEAKAEEERQAAIQAAMEEACLELGHLDVRARDNPQPRYLGEPPPMPDFDCHHCGQRDVGVA